MEICILTFFRNFMRSRCSKHKDNEHCAVLDYMVCQEIVEKSVIDSALTSCCAVLPCMCRSRSYIRPYQCPEFVT